MRVLLLFSSSELGGAERSLTRMALVPSDVAYHLATLDGEGSWCDWVRSIGREPIVFGHRRSTGEHGQFDWRAMLVLLRYVRRERIDVIYVCGMRAAFVLRWLRIFIPGVRLVQGVRWNPSSNSRLDLWFRFVERWFHRMIDCYITNSSVTADTLTQQCKVPTRYVQTIYNGIAGVPQEVRPLVERPLEVLTVSNFNPRKGHREYLRAVRLVLDVLSEARFIFVGRDDMHGEIQHAIEAAGLAHAVRCEGFQADVSVYFRRARVCVLPSLWGEGFPTSLLESLSWGVPVIAYEIDGVAELIDHGVNGFLVTPGDSEMLASRIVSLLSNLTLAERYGHAGRKKVAEQFTVTHCANNHSVCLTQLGLQKKG